MSLKRWLPAVVLGLFLAAPAAPAAAHDATTTAHASVTGAGSSVQVVLDLEYDLLMKSAWLYAEAYDAKERTEQLRQLKINQGAVLDYVTGRFAVQAGEVRCEPAMTRAADVKERDKRAFAVLTLAYTCPREGERSISSALFPDAETFVHSTKTLVAYDLDGRKGSAVLEAGNPTVRVGQDLDAGSFFLLGAEHLLFGLDHLLFLVTLLIGASRLREVVVSASAFTVAHSITFLLAAMGVVAVPGAIVEPIIAASIIVVAVANLVGRGEGRWRLPVVFVFGLIHGLGFAGALDIDRGASWDLLLALLTFNVGIEVAQLALIAVLYPLLALARRTSAARWLTAATSVPIVAISLFWLVERV